MLNIHVHVLSSLCVSLLYMQLALDSNLVKFIFTIHSNLLTSNDDHHLSDGSITNIISTAAALQSDTGYEELQVIEEYIYIYFVYFGLHIVFLSCILSALHCPSEDFY